MIPGNLCQNCMAGYVVNGICNRCGKPAGDSDRPPEALPLGFRLGRYFLGKVLGHGGFGITYLAWDTYTNSRVAVKELYPIGVVTRDGKSGVLRVKRGAESYYNHIRKRFKEEALTIVQLRAHPEVIKIFDLFDSFGTTYYVMEYLDGEDLSKLLRRTGAITWQKLEKPVWDALQILKILHGHGLIHRDISPDNIFVQRCGDAKLIDFGSVRSERAGHFTEIFKAEFAPVELFLANGKQGYWTDTFSLSATVYYMLSGGKLPKQATARLSAVAQGHSDPLIPLGDFSPSAPEYVINAVMHGMAIRIEDRLQNAAEFQRAFFPNNILAQPTVRHDMMCTRGRFYGKMFSLPVGRVVTLGRGMNSNLIAYPQNTQGISRSHCAFYVDANGITYIQDRKSKYGTYLGGKKIAPLTWYRVLNGQPIAVGEEEYQLLE